MFAMGGELTFTYGSNCTFGDLTKLGETLRKRRRNVPSLSAASNYSTKATNCSATASTLDARDFR